MIPEEFSDRIVLEDDCWKWVGRLERAGGPVVTLRINGKGVSRSVRRLIYERVKGVVLKRNQYVTNRCVCETCVNPEHQVMGSRKVIARMLIQKGVAFRNPLQHLKEAHSQQERSPLDWEKVRFARENPDISAKTLAKEWNVSKSAITRVRRNERWVEKPQSQLAFLARQMGLL